MSDVITLWGVECFAYGGVSEAEKQVGQRYRVNVQLYLDLTHAVRSDTLGDTVSYADVHRAVVEVMREERFNLLEAVTGRVCDSLLECFPASSVTVEVQKLLPPIDGTVAFASVTLSRSRP